MTLGISLAISAYAQNPKRDLRQVEKQIESAQKKQESLTFQRDLLKLEINNLKKELVSAARRISRADTNLTELEEKLEDLKNVEANTLGDLDRRQDELAGTISAMIRLNRRPDTILLGSSASLMDNLRAAKIMRRLVPHLEHESSQLGQQLLTLATLRTQTFEQHEALIALKNNRGREQSRLNSLIKSKRNIERKVQRDSKVQHRKIAALGAQAKSLTSLVQKLGVEKKRRDKETAQQRLNTEQKPRQTAIKLIAPSTKGRKPARKRPPPEPSADNQQLASLGGALRSNRTFSSAKGKLPLPVSGKIIARYGKSTESGRDKGIVIETRPQAAVFSPYDGQIAFAGSFRHYGLLLIIDHGEGYHTLLAGMTEINGQVGQHLLAGEPVGQMDIKETQKPTLYMELRREGSPINPHPWFAADIGKVSG